MIKHLLFITIITGFFVSVVAAEDSVFLFNDISQAILLEGLDVRDIQNRVITDTNSIYKLRSLFIISLYQILLTRGSYAESLISEAIRKPFYDFNTIKKTNRKNAHKVNLITAAIIQKSKVERVTISAVYLSILVFVLSKVFLKSYHEPPVVSQVMEILRC